MITSNGKVAGVTVLALTLVACASTGESGGGAPTTASGNTTECFFARNIHDWKALDRKNLIVWETRRKPFHLELMRPCQSLRFANTIALSSRGSRICGYAGDAVVVGGTVPDRCTISSVRALSENSLQELLIHHGQAPPKLKTEKDTSVTGDPDDNPDKMLEKQQEKN